MINKLQSFLQQEQVKTALSRASSLARQWKIQETVGKVPDLLQKWQVQERIDRFYRNSVLPHVKQASKEKKEDIEGGLDRIIAYGLEIKTSFLEETEEQWKLDTINWLNDGEMFLQGNIPDEFRKLTAFAARISPYSGRERLEQIISEHLQMLTRIRKQLRTRSGT